MFVEPVIKRTERSAGAIWWEAGVPPSHSGPTDPLKKCSRWRPRRDAPGGADTGLRAPPETSATGWRAAGGPERAGACSGGGSRPLECRRAPRLSSRRKTPGERHRADAPRRGCGPSSLRDRTEAAAEALPPGVLLLAGIRSWRRAGDQDTTGDPGGAPGGQRRKSEIGRGWRGEDKQ
ncbi:hypothetical protein NDU88_000379 [Pleurodeles waltl]|uniref:Uncharacterized protein n=1 Tax=Pleurodeles waltl TaxID=8319 RepID=A0AAV7VVW3_PLEWA|nr:hypothetical protein NDU88_000379 [Pleurodeles waltl]